ncbi:MAG: hypothetical protein OXF56_25965 [Rhodobacteraceae bacterium]|nr:hypothetical protein [Paracoccaceae bacterium]
MHPKLAVIYYFPVLILQYDMNQLELTGKKKMDGMLPYLLTCIVGLWTAGTSAPPWAIAELDHCYMTPLIDPETGHVSILVEELLSQCQNWDQSELHPRYGWETEFIHRGDTPEFEEMIQQKGAYYGLTKYTTIICTEQQ